MDARRALFSLAYQLSTQLPVYQERLNASLDKITVEAHVRTVFDRLFVEILEDAVPIAERPQILLIDALDEATRNGSNEMAALIGSEFHRMPEWVHWKWSVPQVDPWTTTTWLICSAGPNTRCVHSISALDRFSQRWMPGAPVSSISS